MRGIWKNERISTNNRKSNTVCNNSGWAYFEWDNPDSFFMAFYISAISMEVIIMKNQCAIISRPLRVIMESVRYRGWYYRRSFMLGWFMVLVNYTGSSFRGTNCEAVWCFRYMRRR